MSPEDKLIYELYNFYSGKIVNKVMYSLRIMSDVCLSGEDSGLTNAWDEICVQVQSEESIDWEVYEDTIKMVIKSYVEKEPIPVKHLLSFDDDDYSSDEGDVNKNTDLYYNEEYVIDKIFEQILELAGEYSNAKIRKYLDFNT